jgi:hypothetical protein
MGYFITINPIRCRKLVRFCELLYLRETMEILFASSDMEAAALSESALAKIFGTSARKAGQRLYELAATESLAVAAALPMLKLTQQAGTHRYSVSVSPTHQIFFEPILDSGATARSRKIDLASVTAIRILALGKSNDS